MLSETARSVGDKHHIAKLQLDHLLLQDYRRLRKYLGDSKFGNMTFGFIASLSAPNQYARWLGESLPLYLRQAPEWKSSPEVSELAELECALNLAFASEDLTLMTLQDLANVNPKHFSRYKHSVHPSVRSLTFTQNTTSIWSALTCDELPPRAYTLTERQNILVWRQGINPRFRIWGCEEADAFEALVKHATFAAVCELLREQDKNAQAETLAMNYLRGWITAELLTAD